MTVVKRQNARNRVTAKIFLLSEGIVKELRDQSPALATLIYVDWLPTGQWSAESATV